MAYADAEALIRDWLAGTFTSARVVTELPADLAGALPVVEVTRIGGPDVQPSLDAATFDVDCYDGTRSGSRSLAEEVRAALRFLLPGTKVGNAVVTAVNTSSGPAYRPYDNTNVRRFGATYQIHIKSRP